MGNHIETERQWLTVSSIAVLTKEDPMDEPRSVREPVDDDNPLTFSENPVLRYTTLTCAALSAIIIIGSFVEARSGGPPVMNAFGAIILVTMAAFMYIAPAAYAHRVRHHQRAAITALNLLLGWTILGWVISLIWALTARRSV